MECSHVFLLLKYGEGGLPKRRKAFIGQTNFLGEFIGGRRLFYMEGLVIRSCQREGGFINVFSSNLNTANLEIFPNYSRIFT